MSIVEALIKDIEALRALNHYEDWSPEDRTALDYLEANCSAIKQLLDIAYEQHSDQDRERLRAQNPHLDYSGVRYGFKPIASDVITYLRVYRYGVARLKDDGLAMLLRGLEYARCFDTSSVQAQLLMSPIVANDTSSGLPEVMTALACECGTELTLCPRCETPQSFCPKCRKYFPHACTPE